MADDLSTPLGQDTAKKKRFTLPLALPKAVAAALGLFIATFLIWATVVDDPLGGQPMAVVSVDIAGPAGKKPAPAGPGTPKSGAEDPGATPSGNPAASAVEAGRNPSGLQTVTVIDGTSGKRQEVAVPAAEEHKLPPSIDPHLLENSRHGPIPRIAPDGARPLQVYARPVALAEQHPTIPRIAVVLTGLGIGSSTTAEALAKVPAPVTLAFSPYGIDIDRVVTRARGEGHEVLLMVPMEPFDYPDNDPGPQTLLTSRAPEQNIERLQWLMSRFQG